MHGRASVAGYTLVEIIVALFVFTVGVLALAASSGVVAKAMANGATRELAARSAISRIETITSQCATATSGRETIQQIESDWVTITGLATIEVIESVHCPSAALTCGASYRATIWCPR
jgi:Tfp pilus assembly protein FimT